MFNLFQSTPKINANEAKQLLQRQQASLIDVRTREEFQSGHIAQSVNIPLHDLAARMQALFPNKHASLIVVCYSGARSKEAYFILKKLGYTQVSDLGSILAWPHPIIS